MILSEKKVIQSFEYTKFQIFKSNLKKTTKKKIIKKIKNRVDSDRPEQKPSDETIRI